VLTDCTSAEDGRLLKVSDVIARTAALKDDRSKILVAAVTGPETPYEVILQPGTTAAGVMEQQPTIKHSCNQPDGTYADPAVRIKMWVDAFKGTFVSICDKTFEPALTQIADAIGKAIGPQCVDGKLVDNDLNTPGVQPDCVVTDVTTDASGKKIEALIPSCALNGGAMPCWKATVNAGTCRNGATLVDVTRADKPSNLNTSVQCAVCIPGTPNKGC